MRNRDRNLGRPRTAYELAWDQAERDARGERRARWIVFAVLAFAPVAYFICATGGIS